MIKESIVFLGCTKFSEQILQFLIKEKVKIKAIFSIPREFSISYSKEKVINSNYVDLSDYAKKIDVPYHLIESKDTRRLIDFENELKLMQPEVILAAGWYFMIPKKIRNIARHGAWGLHASILPHYAGGAPLVWALINGEKETGVTLFRMDDGVDDGDIISQKSFHINDHDNIKTLLIKTTKASKEILKETLKLKQINYLKQDKSKIKIYPQRSPADGKIDWSKPSDQIVNFIRAQTKPYPGAWTIINNKKVIIWDAEISNIKAN